MERHEIADIQRARILTAMAEVCSERGASNVTVAHVVARSGVSRRTFYEHFADREQCFLTAFDAAVERIFARLESVCEPGQRWRDRMRASLQALLAFLDAEPDVGRLVAVHALGAGQAALERRRRMLDRAVAAVEHGRAESRRGSEPPPLTGEGVVGAVLAVVHARLLNEGCVSPTSGRNASFVELTNELTSMVVLPYLGASAARRELERPLPETEPAPSASLRTLRGLGIRLTYRTMRVLLAVGAHPRASNRQIADAAGIHDQGQVSKLLWRLEEIGLIRNAVDARVKGEPNAWTLTERGASVQAAISAQTSSC